VELPKVDLNALEDIPFPPGDWEDGPGWDSYWERVLRDTPQSIGWHTYAPMGLIWVRLLLDQWALGGARRLLFVGNGISLTPWAFAWAGHHVVALDRSAVATKFLQTLEVSEKHLRPFFRYCKEAGVPVEERRREGGSVAIVCGDMCDASVAAGPFDVVFSEASLQGLSAPRLSAAADAIRDRTTDVSECHVCVINSESALARIVDEFVRRGFHHCPPGSPPPEHRQRILHSGLGSG
jgi:hypothetical protein